MYIHFFWTRNWRVGAFFGSVLQLKCVRKIKLHEIIATCEFCSYSDHTNEPKKKRFYFKKHEVIELFLLRAPICIFVYPKQEERLLRNLVSVSCRYTYSYKNKNKMPQQAGRDTYIPVMINWCIVYNNISNKKKILCSILFPVESLVYWRDVQKSGVVFGAGLAILLAISLFSVISVIAYASLIVLLGTISFRVYKIVMQTIQKTSDGHPFKWEKSSSAQCSSPITIHFWISISHRDYLDAELILPEEKVTQAATVSVAHVNAFLAELRRLFLVEDFVDSAKFGLLLWVLTYLGSWFNGITLAVIGNYYIMHEFFFSFR